MKKYLAAGACLLLTFNFLACRKSANRPPEPAPVVGKLSKLAYANGAYDSIYYRTDGTISKIVSHNVQPFPYDEVYSFDYDAAKKVTRITDNNGEYYDYRYINGELVAVMHYVGGSKEDYRAYVWNNGKLAEVEEHYRPGISVPGHQLMTRREFAYYADGNLQKETVYNWDAQAQALVKDYSRTYSDYDAHFNPEESISHFLYLSQVVLSNRNARKMISVDERTGVPAEFNFSYTYNDFMNPLSKKMTYVSGGQQLQETVTYHY